MERSAPAVSGAPLSAEAIAQMATSPKSAPRRATKTINDVQVILRKHNRIYTPKGEAPYPTVLFLHGCSGPTKSHERDWANFYASQGYAMIAVDSVAARGLDWVDVCNQDVLNPAERAADVFASLRYARSLPIVDPDRLVLTGFAHGGSTVWASLLLASGNIPPIGIRTFPVDALQGVRAAYIFHAPCLAPWTVDVPAIAFKLVVLLMDDVLLFRQIVM
jgi:dienelactone hydrolase